MTEPANPAQPEKPRNPRALLEAFERTTRPLGDGQRPNVPRRTIQFTVDHTVCNPGVFEEDFEVTLTALTPHDELAATRESKGDVMAMAMSMARRCISHVNGAAVDRSVGMDEWLWNALGTGGRQLVTAMFAYVGTPGEEALGKAQTSLKVG